jgi:hypothetical protein
MGLVLGKVRSKDEGLRIEDKVWNMLRNSYQFYAMNKKHTRKPNFVIGKLSKLAIYGI